MSSTHLWQYVRRNLRHGGQRLLIAVLSIAFGVMSLVGMSTLTDAVATMVLVDGRLSNGGDFMLWPNDSFLNAEQIEMVQQWQADGLIDAYSISTSNHALFYHNPATGEAEAASLARGIDPATYPLVGEFVLQGDADTNAASLLQQPTDLLITRDIAQKQALAVGDNLVLISASNPEPLTFSIVGVLQDTPDHSGNALFYNQEAANLLNGWPQLGSRIHIVAPTADPHSDLFNEQLQAQNMWPLTATAADESNEETYNIFKLAFKGAGLLGLMVGGIGIANTMQILMARRTKEVAILKSVGYSQRDLQRLFIVETAVLGVIGTLLGLFLSIGLSYGLVTLFSNMTTYLIGWKLNPTTILLGSIVGVLTTVIFALWAIIRVSRVHPSALLRNEPISFAQMGWVRSGLLLLALLIPFTVVAAVVLGSVLEGIGVILFALAGLVFVGGTFAGLLWLVARFLPTGRFYLLKLATNRLRRQGFGLLFAMIALFAGLLTLSLTAVMIQTTQQEMSDRDVSLPGPNLFLLPPNAQLDQLQQAITAYNPEEVRLRHLADVQQIVLQLPDGTEIEHAPQIVSESVGWQTPAAPANPTAAYHIYVSYNDLPEGSVAHITTLDGTVHTLPLQTAPYELMEVIAPQVGQAPLLVDEALLQEWATETELQLLVRLPETAVAENAAELRRTFPDVVAINLDSWVDTLVEAYRNLYWLALSMASLALLAGMLLVANAVTLAMLNRRQEMGVLQALGYSRRQILQAILLEYGLMAAVTSGVTVVAVYLFFWLLPLLEPTIEGLFSLNGGMALALFALGIGLTAVAALAAAWQPTKVSPHTLLVSET